MCSGENWEERGVGRATFYEPRKCLLASSQLRYAEIRKKIVKCGTLNYISSFGHHYGS